MARGLVGVSVLLGAIVLGLLIWVGVLLSDRSDTYVGGTFIGTVSAYSSDSICVERDVRQTNGGGPVERPGGTRGEGDCGHPIVLGREDYASGGEVELRNARIRVGSAVTVTEVWLAVGDGHLLGYYVEPR